MFSLRICRKYEREAARTHHSNCAEPSWLSTMPTAPSKENLLPFPTGPADELALGRHVS